MIALTERQIAAIEWVVRVVRAGELEEEFTVTWIRAANDATRAALPKFAGDTAAIPPINGDIFGVLVHAGLLFASPPRDTTVTYTVLEAAYAFVDARAAPKPPPLSRVALRRLLDGRLTATDLKNICFDMDIHHEDVHGETLSDQIRELLTLVERKQCLDELHQVLVAIRPDLAADLAL